MEFTMKIIKLRIWIIFNVKGSFYNCKLMVRVTGAVNLLINNHCQWRRFVKILYCCSFKYGNRLIFSIRLWNVFALNNDLVHWGGAAVIHQRSDWRLLETELWWWIYFNLPLAQTLHSGTFNSKWNERSWMSVKLLRRILTLAVWKSRVRWEITLQFDNWEATTQNSKWIFKDRKILCAFYP